MPLRELRDYNRSKIFEALDRVRGRKALVLEPEFAGPLGLVVEASALREHGVEIFGALDDAERLVPQLATQGVRQVVYVLRGTQASLFGAVRHVSHCRQHCGVDLEFTWLLVPRPTRLAARLLDGARLTADVATHALPLTWICMDEDVLSLELPGALRALAADGDVGCLWDLAVALDDFQARYGAVPRIKAKGAASVELVRLLGRMRHDRGAEAPALGGGPAMMVVLDRSVDMITPSCMQFTYEGLLEELLGLRCGQLQLPAEAGRKVYGLNASDAVFQETRGRLYQDARRWINDSLRDIQRFRDQRLRTAEIPALHGFVAELRGKLERLRLHTELVEAVAGRLQQPALAARAAIEAALLNAEDQTAAVGELVHCEDDPVAVLRLLCLCSAVHGGLPRRALDALRRDFLNAYGHRHLLTLAALQRAGLVKAREAKRSAYAAVAAALRLMPAPEPGAEPPPDISYVYAGYAPLSARIVQAAVGQGGWAAQRAALEALPGPSLEVVQGTSAEGRPTHSTDRSADGVEMDHAQAKDASSQPAPAAATPRRPVVIVVLVGGVTSAEVAALRLLSQHKLVPCDFVVATTAVVTGRSLMLEFAAV